MQESEENKRLSIDRRQEEQRQKERRETIEELSALLTVVQEMGSRLAEETHNESYAMVRDLIECLHLAHIKLERIRQASTIQ